MRIMEDAEHVNLTQAAKIVGRRASGLERWVVGGVYNLPPLTATRVGKTVLIRRDALMKYAEQVEACKDGRTDRHRSRGA